MLSAKALARLSRSCRPLQHFSGLSTSASVSSALQLPPRWGPPPPGTRVHICLSGGVDSSVAACLLRDAGYDLRPIFMRNWETLDEDSASGGCEWEKDFADVERLCRESLGGAVPELVDLSREYWADVFQPALSDWERGITPNPDVSCNQKIKFKALPERLLARDPSAWLATGHYAQLLPSPFDASEPSLHRAAYLPKDQSYYLSTSPMSALHRTMFPLGHLASKEEVRKLARKFGLHTAEKRESMGICFVGVRKRFGSFLDSYLPESPGAIEDGSGKVVGQHSGLWRYTIGEGAKLSGFPQKMFVGRKDVNRNVVVVVPASSPLLQCIGVTTSDFSWISPSGPSSSIDASTGWPVSAQTRSLQAGALTDAIVFRSSSGNLDVRFAQALVGVSPGQAVVLYQGGHCLGGGTIKETRTVWDQEKQCQGEVSLVETDRLAQPPYSLPLL